LRRLFDHRIILLFILTVVFFPIHLESSEISQNGENKNEIVSSSGQSSEENIMTEDESDDEEVGGEEGEGEEEEEEEVVEGTQPAGIRYTADISDEMLEELFSKNPAALGSISVGFVNFGRLINGVKFPEGKDWVIVNPQKSYGTKEVVDYLISVAKYMRERFPDAPPLRINDLSAERGGYIRPHKSHQNGRDVDIGFYYIYDPKNPKSKKFDVEKNWEFIKAIITKTDVQVILVDRRIQKQMYEYAKSIGENVLWLDSIFKSGEHSIIKHARRHRGHFHIRFYSPRAQELGKRIHPILDKAKEEERIALHKVRRGECLGKIAAKYNSSVSLIKKANHLKSNHIRAGMTLFVPLLGPCHNCPEPPDFVLPKRRLPEDFIDKEVQSASMDRTESAKLPLNYYFNLYPFTRLNSFWLKLDKY
jgi:LysM repeat protein